MLASIVQVHPDLTCRKADIDAMDLGSRLIPPLIDRYSPFTKSNSWLLFLRISLSLRHGLYEFTVISTS